MATIWEQEPKNGTRIGTKREQNGNKAAPKTEELDKNGNKVGTRT